MAKLILSTNWEIKDDSANSKLIIRSKSSGETFEIDDLGNIESSGNIDADTVGGLTPSELGSGGSNVVTLNDDGKLNESVLPNVSITETLTTAVPDGRLSIESNQNISLSKGDIVIETASDPSISYILTDSTDSTLQSSWTKLGITENRLEPSDFYDGGNIELDHDLLSGRTHIGDNITPDTSRAAVALGVPSYTSISNIPEAAKRERGDMFYVVGDDDFYYEDGNDSLKSLGAGANSGSSGPISRIIPSGDELTINYNESMEVLNWYNADGDLTVKGDFLINKINTN